MKQYVLSFGLGFFLFASTGSASSLCEGINGNLVLNCGFDMGSTPSGSGQDPVDWTAAQFTGFEAIVSSPVNDGDPYSMRIANDEFQGGEPLFNGAAIMSQSFTDTPGEQYTFGFYIDNGQPNGGEEQFQAFWGPSASPTSETPVFADNGSLTNSFTPETFTVTGTGSDTITFTSYNTPSYYYLADVSLVDTGISVSGAPEPGTLLLMSAAIAVVIWGRLKLNGRAA